MLKKIFLFAISFGFLHGSFANAAAFDYRLYYGNTFQKNKKISNGFSASIYSYPEDSNFAYGVQGDISTITDTGNGEKTHITSASLLIGYDFSRILHMEINGGMAGLYKNQTITKGYHAGITFLAQTNYDAYLEAIQIGLSLRHNTFPSIKEKETEYLIFLGFGF